MGARRAPRDLALFFLTLTGLMLTLEITITNVALPTIQRALGMTPHDLVVNAYSLAFGGFLLLGGGGWPTGWDGRGCSRPGWPSISHRFP